VTPDTKVPGEVKRMTGGKQTPIIVEVYLEIGSQALFGRL